MYSFLSWRGVSIPQKIFVYKTFLKFKSRLEFDNFPFPFQLIKVILITRNYMPPLSFVIMQSLELMFDLKFLLRSAAVNWQIVCIAPFELHAFSVPQILLFPCTCTFSPLSQDWEP